MCVDLTLIITAIKDVLLGVAAATTAIVAVLGLRRWRQELEGKAHFEAARNLIRSTYRLRDAIRAFRNPFYGAHEFPEGYKHSIAGPVDDREEARAWGYIYANRWKPVWDALQEFDAHTLEAEALWGQSIRTKTDALRQCLSELSSAMSAVIEDKARGGRDFEADKEFGKNMRSIVYASINDKDNKLNQKLAAALEGIEQELRTHLRRS